MQFPLFGNQAVSIDANVRIVDFVPIIFFEQARQDCRLEVPGHSHQLARTRSIGNDLRQLEQPGFGAVAKKGVRLDAAFMKADYIGPSIHSRGGQLLHHGKIVALFCIAMFELCGADPNIFHISLLSRVTLTKLISLAQTEIQIDAVEMACIAPGFDYPAVGAVEFTVADDGQAGIGGDVAARLIQR